MHKSLLLVTALMFMSRLSSQITQIDCSQGKFYGYGTDNKIHEMTITGTSITLGASTPTVTQYNRNGLAISNLGSGNGFYSSGTETTSLAFNVLRFANSGWLNLFPNSWKRPLNNAGGHGNKLYYQYMGASYNSDSARYSKIYSFTNNTLNLIFCDTNLHMQVADIAVDTDGNVYFFSGPQKIPSMAVSALNVISPTGSLLATYPVSVDGNLAYGCFLMGSTLYVGFQANATYPDKLLPLTLNNGTLMIGSPLVMPKPTIGGTLSNPTYLRFNDLASCNAGKLYVKPTTTISTVGIKSASEDNQVKIYPNPAIDKLNIHIQKETSALITIHDTFGRLVLCQTMYTNNYSFDLSNFKPGIYFVLINFGNQNIKQSFIVK